MAILVLCRKTCKHKEGCASWRVGLCGKVLAGPPTDEYCHALPAQMRGRDIRWFDGRKPKYCDAPRLAFNGGE